MSLNDIWYVLFIVIISGYLVLDGFDLGVGILHLFVARSDHERRVTLNSIGPVWDGNEVWLVVGGGALFAAFPLVYASLFSGFYLAMMLVLLFLIMRTVAIEFRSKRPSPTWRSFWDFMFFLSSLFISVLLGVAFGNIISGIPLDAAGNISAPLFDLLTPFALLVAVTTVAMLALHGSIYLAMKTEGDLLKRVTTLAPRLMVVFFTLNTLIVILSLTLARPDHRPLSAAAVAGHFPRRRPRRLPHRLAHAPPGSLFPGVRGFRLHDLPPAGHGGRRTLSQSAPIDPRPGVSSHHPQRRRPARDPEGDADLRRHRHAIRHPLHRRRLLHLPG